MWGCEPFWLPAMSHFADTMREVSTARQSKRVMHSGASQWHQYESVVRNVMQSFVFERTRTDGRPSARSAVPESASTMFQRPIGRRRQDGRKAQSAEPTAGHLVERSVTTIAMNLSENAHATQRDVAAELSLAPRHGDTKMTMSHDPAKSG